MIIRWKTSKFIDQWRHAPACDIASTSRRHIYRPQGKVIFSEASVCPPGGCLLGVCVPTSAYLEGGSPSRGDLCLGGAWMESSRWPLQQSVRILLECILVSVFPAEARRESVVVRRRVTCCHLHLDVLRSPDAAHQGRTQRRHHDERLPSQSRGTVQPPL